MPAQPYRATVRYDVVFTHLARAGRTLCGQIVDDRTFGPEEMQRTCPSCVMAESMTHFGQR